jgi:aminopeptidase N
LHQLRLDLGAEVFDRALDAFGLKHGGQRVTSQQFQEHMEAASGRKLEQFFSFWLKDKGLPK